jgi:hypothetical protein
MTMSVVTSVSTVGSKKLPPCAARLPPVTILTPLDRVGDVLLDLLDRLGVDQRRDYRTRFKPVGDLHRPGGLGEALGEGVATTSCTRMRLAQTRVWQALRYIEAIAPPASAGASS